jgi:hypothetical protein
MDLISYLAINEVALNATTTGKRANKALERIQLLEAENRELRIRIGVLIRLLIEHGVFSAEDFDGAVKQVQAQLSPQPASKAPNRVTRQKKR